MQRTPQHTDHRLPFGSRQWRFWIIVIITTSLWMGYGMESYAQEKKGKTEYEKKNERKNKANRKSRRGKDKAKSNRAERRALRFKTRHKQGDKAYHGDVTGRRIKPITSSKSRVNYAQPNPYAGRKRMTEARKAKYQRSQPRYSQRPRERAARGLYMNNRSISTTFSGKKAYKFNAWPTASNGSERSIRSKRIIPRSASGAYVKRKRKNPYAFREKSKWETAFSGDITGRKFRAKGTTDRPGIQGPPSLHNRRKTRRGDKAYSGRAAGSYASASRSGERAGSKAGNGRRRLSISRQGEHVYNGNIHYRRNMSISKDRDQSYAGRISPRRDLSISGKHNNIFSRSHNSGRNLSASGKSERTSAGLPKSPVGAGLRIAGFQGSMRARRPLKGGGSISGGLHNNNGRSTNAHFSGRQDIQSAQFRGHARPTRVNGGGGSISGGIHNNNGRPTSAHLNGRQDIQVAQFRGRSRSTRITGGGGSITSGMKRNNGDKPIPGVGPRRQDIQGLAYSGKTKGSRRPPKGGGGSISVLPWNNGGKPLPKEPVSNETRIAAVFTGKTRRKFNYKHNPNASDESLDARPPGKNYYQAVNYKGTVKAPDYSRNPNKADDALKGIAPSGAVIKATQFQGTTKRLKYTRNPSSADGALKGIGPSRAVVQATQFQGNVKMSRKRIEDRHPSYKFADKSRPVNKTGFSLKLMWSKMFKKQENQPDNLKEKDRKPRFDRGEKGIWND